MQIKNFIYKFIRRVGYKLFGHRVPGWEDAFYRNKVDALRLNKTMLTTIDSVLAKLQLKELMPSHVRALEPFGRMGYWKTLDYVDKCESLDFYEIEPEFCEIAKSHLPEMVDIHCANSIDTIIHHNTPRHDYNFVHLDSHGFELFGKNYCEHFDMIPALFEVIADNAIIIANVFRSNKSYNEFDPSYIQRRLDFFNLTRPEDAMLPSTQCIIAAYKSRLPKRLHLRDAFFVPHPSSPTKEIHYVVLVLGPSSQ